MATLNKKVKEFIIILLARMERPSEVVKLVKQKFNIEVSRQQVVYYNPESYNGTRLAKGLRHLFYNTRRKYVEDESEVPIFHKGYRMNEIQGLYEKAKKAGNIVLAMDLLEQAAKESGGFYEKGALPTKSDDDDIPFYVQLNQQIINQAAKMEKSHEVQENEYTE